MVVSTTFIPFLFIHYFLKGEKILYIYILIPYSQPYLPIKLFTLLIDRQVGR
jgi:hypothetical protein